MIGGQNYPRLKFGIGDDFHKGQQVDYVLSPFKKKEFEDLPFFMDKAIEAIFAFASIGVDRAMSQYNG